MLHVISEYWARSVIINMVHRLEPSGLVHSDGNRPDGVTVVLCKNGKSLIWDATCPDTLARSYRAAATSSTGAVAARAKTRKLAKYDSLAQSHTIVPEAIESLGVIGLSQWPF